MTIWALALLAATARAANVAPRVTAPSGGGSAVRALPSLNPSLGGAPGAGGSLGQLDLRGTLPALPAPLPGLAQGLPAAYFVPPGALGFKKVDAQSAAAAPATQGDLAPAPAPAAPGRAPRRGGLLPARPDGASVQGALPADGRESAAPAGLMPALGASDAAAPRAPVPDESAVGSGRSLFDNAAAKPAVDLSGFSLPSRPEPGSRAAALSPSVGVVVAETSVPAPHRGGAAAARPGESGFLPDAGLVAARSPLPGAVAVPFAVADAALRDAVASPSAALAPLGGHAPLLARPSRLALGGEGLVVRVSPLPDSLLKGRGAFGAAPAPAAPAPAPARRLVSTELLERGALLEAVSAADAAVGRGLLGLPDGDVPGVMAGSLKLRGASAPAPARPVPSPVRRSAGEKALVLLGLSLLPLAAALAARRFL